MSQLRDFLFHEEPGITLYCGDCREVLEVMGLVDVIVTDPPYGDTSLAWDIGVREWIGRARYNLKREGSLWCFGSMRAFMRTAAEWRDWNMAQEIIWEKHNGSSFHADRFKRVHEHAVQFYPDDVPWSEIYKAPVFTNDATARTVRRKQRPPHTGHIEAGSYVSQDGGPRLLRSVIYVRSEHGRAEHPTQKPLGIIRPLLDYSCPAGGLVLDPFVGSGSTLLAARESGRRAIGIEIEEKYCEIAVRRLRQEILPLSILTDERSDSRPPMSRP